MERAASDGYIKDLKTICCDVTPSSFHPRSPSLFLSFLFLFTLFSPHSKKGHLRLSESMKICLAAKYLIPFYKTALTCKEAGCSMR